jgi:hypothetical protein
MYIFGKNKSAKANGSAWKETFIEQNQVRTHRIAGKWEKVFVCEIT